MNFFMVVLMILLMMMNRMKKIHVKGSKETLRKLVQIPMSSTKFPTLKYLKFAESGEPKNFSKAITHMDN